MTRETPYCLIGPYTRIYDTYINIRHHQEFVCFLASTIIKDFLLRVDKFMDFTCLTHNSFVHDIDIDERVSKEDCAIQNYIRSIDWDWVLSKQFCAILKMPPPPGSGP
jgi:hypothetical protein